MVAFLGAAWKAALPAKARLGVGEEAHHAGAPADLFAQALQPVGALPVLVVRPWQACPMGDACVAPTVFCEVVPSPRAVVASTATPLRRHQRGQATCNAPPPPPPRSCCPQRDATIVAMRPATQHHRCHHRAHLASALAPPSPREDTPYIATLPHPHQPPHCTNPPCACRHRGARRAITPCPAPRHAAHQYVVRAWAYGRHDTPCANGW